MFQTSRLGDRGIEVAFSQAPRKRDGTYVQHIDLDVRRTNDRKQPTKKKLRKLTKGMVELENEPAISPLLKKRYLSPVNSSKSDSNCKKRERKYEALASDGCEILYRKISAQLFQMKKSRKSMAQPS